MLENKAFLRVRRGCTVYQPTNKITFIFTMQSVISIYWTLWHTGTYDKLMETSLSALYGVFVMYNKSHTHTRTPIPSVSRQCVTGSQVCAVLHVCVCVCDLFCWQQYKCNALFLHRIAAPSWHGRKIVSMDYIYLCVCISIWCVWVCAW